MSQSGSLRQKAEEALAALSKAAGSLRPGVVHQEVGRVLSIGAGVAAVSGLSGALLDEVVVFESGVEGYCADLGREAMGVILLGPEERVAAGERVRRTGEPIRVPVGETLLGRVVNAIGEPIDGGVPLEPEGHLAIEREAPRIVDRQPVREPLQTGLKSIDTAIPIGRGQRELILGDRRLGKTTIAVDTILNQRGKDVVCFYVSIGQKSATTAKLIEVLRQRGAMDYTCVVVGAGGEAPGLQFVAPYAGCAMSEWFMERGRDTLIVYDDLSKHADIYRELSLLLRRPPGREAFPGDIFYIHSRLLERSAKLSDRLGGGSQTALPIVETQAQNIAAYIPTNLISITDGQIYLSPDLFNQGHRPAVDVGRSVSRVGGETQLPAMRALGGPVRLEYSQYLELEVFTKFGARVEKTTQEAIRRGRRIKEALKQPPHDPWAPGEQVAVFFAAHDGLLDDIPADAVGQFQERLRERLRERAGELMAGFASGRPLGEAEKAELRRLTQGLKAEFPAAATQQG